MTTPTTRPRSTGARERERTPAELQDMQNDIAGLKAEVAHMKANLNSWTKDMEKRVDDHNKEFDKKDERIRSKWHHAAEWPRKEV